MSHALMTEADMVAHEENPRTLAGVALSEAIDAMERVYPDSPEVYRYLLRRLNERGADRFSSPARARPANQEVSEAVRWEIFERDNFTCQDCGSHRRLTVDHAKDKDNLQTLCRSCNCRKGSR